MRSGVSLSNQHVDIADYAQHHADVGDSLKLFFSDLSPYLLVRCFGLSKDEVEELLEERLAEAEMTSSMALLSGIEALFRIDFVNRVDKRGRDNLSKAFEELHRASGSRVNLEDGILGCWKDHTNVSRQVISDLRGAFKYRHWLAHGRYWTPKLGRKYDYNSIYLLASAVKSGFPLSL